VRKPGEIDVDIANVDHEDVIRISLSIDNVENRFRAQRYTIIVVEGCDPILPIALIG
jgi:hypothetical protein